MSLANTIAEREITGLTCDSRQVRPGFLFAALPGTKTDGRSFVADALARGAAAVLTAPTMLGALNDLPVPVLTDPNPRRSFARMAARFFGRQPDCVVAVTGTNGKTSTAEFTRQLWAGLGTPAASIGTLGLRAPHRVVDGGLTTPDPVKLHQELAELADAGVDHVAMEASSHGLSQYRLDGVRLSAVAFTNLTRDHLDYHGGMDAYFAAKARLFTELVSDGGAAVINLDVAEGMDLAEIARARDLRLITYGQDGREMRIRDIRPRPTGQHLSLDLFGHQAEIDLPLAGDFQVYNALAALGLVVASGAKIDDAVHGLSRLSGVPGRLQKVAEIRGAAIYVDYAHTPDALQVVLTALRPHAEGRLSVVFGCGGDRDAGKRPQMGAIASRLADQTVVTDDNPRSENAAAIRAQIMAAATGASEIADRRTAIFAAVEGLKKGDLLVVAGKGHEQGQIVGDQVLPFDDAAVVRQAVQEIGA